MLSQTKFCGLLIIEIFISFFPLYGQEVKIGQHCPNVELGHVLNYKGDKLNLSDFRGKLIILDFWSPGCASCIAAFPEMEALQKEWNDKIQIILVNAQSTDSTLHFFSKRPKIKMPDLPLITSDTILAGFFPHNAFPLHVWIDSNRVVRYITAGYNTNEKTIRDFLNGNLPSLKQKKEVLDFNFNVPVIAEGNGRWVNRALYYSYIMRHIPTQVGSMIEADRIFINSASIARLFKLAYSEGAKYNFDPTNTVVLEVRDKSKYLYPKNMGNFDQWAAKNDYYYELKIPSSQSGRLYQYMQEDLKRYFNVDAKVEKRKIVCLVLVKRGNINSLQSKGGTIDTNINSAAGDTECYFHNYTFKQILQKLQPFYANSLPTPFMDGTGYTGKIDIVFKREAVMNLSLLKNELAEYNLYLVKKEWPADVLVISEKNYKR